MDQTPLWDFARCPLRYSSERGHYFAVLAKVSTVQEAKLTAWMSASHVYFTGKPAAVCRYQTRDTMMGSSWAFRVEGVIYVEKLKQIPPRKYIQSSTLHDPFTDMI